MHETRTLRHHEEKKGKTQPRHGTQTRVRERVVEVNCNSMVVLQPKTKSITDEKLSRRCTVNGHQFLDPTRLCLDKDGICDACNGLTNTISNTFVSQCYICIDVCD